MAPTPFPKPYLSGQSLLSHCLVIAALKRCAAQELMPKKQLADRSRWSGLQVTLSSRPPHTVSALVPCRPNLELCPLPFQPVGRASWRWVACLGGNCFAGQKLAQFCVAVAGEELAEVVVIAALAEILLQEARDGSGDFGCEAAVSNRPRN